MSLTSALKDKNHWITNFIKTEFFDLKELEKEVNNEIKRRCETLLLPEEENHYPWSEVGHITEYLTYKGLTGTNETIYPYIIIKNYFPNAYPELLTLENKLTVNNNFSEYLLFYWKLAKIESLLRSGKRLKEKDILYQLQLNKILSLNIINDCENIYQSIYKEKFLNSAKGILINPNFDRVNIIGGADGDVILHHNNESVEEQTLVDFKNTKLHFKKSFIEQVLAYSLLDFVDEFKLTHIAIYMPRQAFLWKTSLEDIVLDFSNYKSISVMRKELLMRIKNTK